MLTIEISSYPKSGNTWLVKLVEQFLIDGKARNPLKIQNIHSKPELITEQLVKGIGSSLPMCQEPLYFYKSHPFKNPLINPNKVLYIYRHPLDVLLSTLNWFYMQYQDTPDRFTPQRKKRLFYRSEPKSCEDIFKDDEMDYYLFRFIENLGENFHRGILGENSNYFKHVKNALHDKDTVCIKYEDLINDTSGTLLLAMEKLLQLEAIDLNIDTAKVDKITKGSGQKFYWKAKSGSRFDMLTPSQIQRFENTYRDSLDEIGY